MRNPGEAAQAHLWRHFSVPSQNDGAPAWIADRAEGCYVVDDQGVSRLDGFAGLGCVTIGYGFGDEIGRAALAQFERLPYQSCWESTNSTTAALARRIADLAPAGLDRVFFTTSGGEAVETAWKVARQYHRLRGENRWKAISRYGAYHGTTLGALGLTGMPEIRAPFEPVATGVIRARNCDRLSRPVGETDEEFTAFLLEELEYQIVADDPSTIAMMIIEPFQMHGTYAPPAGYQRGVRRLCDKYGILLVADETVTAWGRFGAWFASDQEDAVPDIITTAKGLTSAYAVMGALICSETVFEVFKEKGSFVHGNTYGGHPVSAAVALKNIEIIDRLQLPARVRVKQDEFAAALAPLAAFDLVRDVRGAGYLYCVELHTQRVDGRKLSPADLQSTYGDRRIVRMLHERGVITRANLEDGRQSIQLAPPLIADTPEFETLAGSIREVIEILSPELGY
jgi:adenosylmethionine-8-amino-7-oxononanoate aminotransferase